MEIPFGSINFAKPEIRVLISPNFLRFVLIFTVFISKSTSISHDFPKIPYSQFCNGVVKESESTETQLSPDNFLRLDKAVYSLGFENPQFNFNPIFSQIASFSTRKVYETKSKGVFKVNALLNLIGPNIFDYFSGDITRRRLRLVKFRPPRIEPKNIGAGFRLFGFWDSDSGKLCMVGSGSVSSLRSINVVFKLNYPNSSVLNTSLVNGTLQSGSVHYTTYFKPISILGVSRMGYNYSFIYEEIKNGAFSVYDEMENVSLSLPDSGICSIITWGLRFELDYDRYDCNNNNSSCSFQTVGDEILPRFMSIKVVDCLKDGKVRYILQFSNSTYGKGFSFYPLTSLVAEGEWDGKKKRLELVACQLFDKMSKIDCSIRLAFSLPSTLSLKHRSSIVGKMWSSETKNLGHVSFQSPANLNLMIKNVSYEYLEHEKVKELCVKSQSFGGKTSKGTYPDEQSPNLRFDMMVRNKKGQIAYGYASPLFVFDKFYSPFSKIESRHNLTNGYVNISYVMSFTTRGEFEFGGKLPSHEMVEISAEGMYNTKNGVICMVGCKHMPYEKFQKKRSLDCELLIDINFSPLNGKDAGMVIGSIKTTRKKPDPLYFEPVEFGSSSISTGQARESIWRMDLEITMVLISNTLACIFIGSQFFHAKKNPESRAFVSVIMLVVLTLAHMVPLLLNFEAVFFVNRKRNVVLGTDQWLEVNEVLVRVITMVAFVLQFGLLQLTWSSRTGPENPKRNLWVFDKKVLYVSIPLYIAGGLTAWFAHLLQNSHTKPIQRFRAQNSVTFWGGLKSYVGLILDGFLIPQILFNFFCDARELALAPLFYVGCTIVRLLPHVYDLYRTHSSLWFYEKIYANPGMDYYSTTWDVAVCCCGMIFVVVIYAQQRFGGQSVVPKRFRERVLYQKVPVIITTQEQQVF